jgi:hypothetical protein
LTAAVVMLDDFGSECSMYFDVGFRDACGIRRHRHLPNRPHPPRAATLAVVPAHLGPHQDIDADRAWQCGGQGFESPRLTTALTRHDSGGALTLREPGYLLTVASADNQERSTCRAVPGFWLEKYSNWPNWGWPRARVRASAKARSSSTGPLLDRPPD